MGEVIYITEASDEEIRSVLREAGTRLSTLEIAKGIAARRLGKPVSEETARVQRLVHSIEERLTPERMEMIEKIIYSPPATPPKSLFVRLIEKLTRIG